MNVVRLVVAVVVGLAAWFLSAFVGLLVAAERVSSTRDVAAGHPTFVVFLVIGAALATAVSLLVLRGGDPDRRPRRPLMVAIGMLWPVVMGVGGILDGRSADEPAAQGVIMLVLGVGVSAAVAWWMTRSAGRGRG